MIVQAIYCKKCHDTIYSRAHYDMRWCSCGKCAIDGGFDYIKVYGNSEEFLHTSIKVPMTKAELYNDWDTKADKYGLIKGVKNAVHNKKRKRTV